MSEMSEEKKLTDEEIIKALDICYSAVCCTSKCPYFNKDGRNFCVENKAFYRDMKRIVQEHTEQKAEIERLTEENDILKGNPPILVGRSLGKTIRAKLFAFDKMKGENAELQKQVDELKARNMSEMIDLFNNETDRLIEKAHQQAVKDTAREIYDEIDDSDILVLETQEYGEIEVVPMERLQEIIKNRGVEVE